MFLNLVYMFTISADGVNMYTLQEKPIRLKPGEARERGAPDRTRGSVEPASRLPEEGDRQSG